MYGSRSFGTGTYAGTGTKANAGNAGGNSALTAAGDLVGNGVASATSAATASGDLVANGLIIGSSLLTAFQVMAQIFGTAQAQAFGQEIAKGLAGGNSVLTHIQSLLIGAGSIEGDSNVVGFPFYPAYTDWVPESLLFTFVGEPINESDSAFEQAGRLVLCAEKTVQGQQEVWLYWFDPVVGRFVFEKICLGSNPRVILDDPLNTVTSDILLFYITPIEQRVCYRQQRDRYLIEYQTPLVKDPHSYIDLYLQDVVKSRDGRLVILGAQRSIQKGQWNYIRLESALYPFVIDIDQFQAQQSFLDTSALSLVRKTVYILGETPPITDGTPVGWIDLDSYTSSVAFQNTGSLRSLIIFVGPPGTLNPVGAAVPFYDDVEEYQASLAYQSGTFVVVVITNTLFDIDEFQAATVFQSGTLIAVVIVIVLFDVDEFTSDVTFVATGSSLV